MKDALHLIHCSLQKCSSYLILILNSATALHSIYFRMVQFSYVQQMTT